MDMQKTFADFFLNNWITIFSVIIPTILSIIAIVRQVKKERADITKTEAETAQIIKDIYSDVIDDIKAEMNRCKEKVKLIDPLENRVDKLEEEKKFLILLVKELINTMEVVPEHLIVKFNKFLNGD